MKKWQEFFQAILWSTSANAITFRTTTLPRFQLPFRYHVFFVYRKTTIALVCDETEEGRVDPMKNVFVSELYVSTLAVCNVIEKRNFNYFCSHNSFL